jgi:hypothetical protein
MVLCYTIYPALSMAWALHPGLLYLFFLTIKFMQNCGVSENKNNRQGEEGAEGRKMIRNGIFLYAPSSPWRLNFFKFW